MTEDDGITLTCSAHPSPQGWWARFKAWLGVRWMLLRWRLMPWRYFDTIEVELPDRREP